MHSTNRDVWEMEFFVCPDCEKKANNSVRHSRKVWCPYCRTHNWMSDADGW